MICRGINLKKGILAIFDFDVAYATQFMNYWNQRNEIGMEAQIFTKKEALEQIMDSIGVEILLAREDTDVSAFSGKAVHIILLSEGRCVKEKEEYPVLYQFQSAEYLLREILSIYAEHQGNTERYYYSRINRKIEKVGIFSPNGGSKKTTFALALGQALGENKKVLYINLELFPGIYQRFSRENTSGFSELIYYIKQKRSNFTIKLQSLVQRIGTIDYILPPGHYTDLNELEEEDIYYLLEELEKGTTYDVVIFDVGFINEAGLILLELCDRVYMPSFPHSFAKEKEELLFSLLKAEGREVLCEKIQRICVPFDSEIDRGEFHIEHLCMGVLGAFVSQLLDQWRIVYEQ